MATIIVTAFFLTIGLTVLLAKSYYKRESRKKQIRSYEAWNRSRKMRYY